MRVKLLLVLSMVFTLAWTTANAQVQQTAEGAQDFIRITATVGRAGIEIPRELGLNRISYSYEVKCITSRYSANPGASKICQVSHEITVPSFVMSAVTSPEICSSRFTLVNNLPAQQAAKFPDAWAVDWAAIQKIEQDGRSVTLSPNGARFWFHAEDVAVRFAYAATFLKDSCDPTAGTGF